MLDIGPPKGQKVHLGGDREFAVTIGGGGAAYSTGRLVEGGGIAGDILEGFIVALAGAGFPVHLQEFRECLTGYLDTAGEKLAEEISPEDRERWERELVERRLEFVWDDGAWRLRSLDHGVFLDPCVPMAESRDAILGDFGGWLGQLKAEAVRPYTHVVSWFSSHGALRVLSKSACPSQDCGGELLVVEDPAGVHDKSICTRILEPVPGIEGTWRVVQGR